MSGRLTTYRTRLWMGWVLVVPALMIIFSPYGGIFRAAALGSRLADLQFVVLTIAIYAILPPITAEAIAGEKENRSLTILMLTDLTPTEMILQKYMSRMIPMATLLLLSAPVFAVAYAYGGITADSVSAMLLILVFTAMQVGAIAIFCSALCGNTTSAIVATYTIGAAFYFGPYLVAQLDHATLQVLGGFTDVLFTCGYGKSIALAWVPFYRFAGCQTFTWNVLAASIPVLFTTVVFLILARQAMLRSLTEAAPTVARRFQNMDTVLERLNTLVGNRVFGGLSGNLPEYAPVEWREKHRLGMARRDHLVRLVLMVELPVVVLMVLLVTVNAPAGAWVALTVLTWLVCGLVVLVQSTMAFPIERTNQTIDILFATPLDTGEIVQQKYAAVNRLLNILMMPCLTTIAPFLLSSDRLLCTIAFACFFVSMRSLMLIGLRCGAKVSSRLRAFASAIVWGGAAALPWTLAVVLCLASGRAMVFGIPILLFAMRTGRDRHLSQTTEALERQRRPGHTWVVELPLPFA